MLTYLTHQQNQVHSLHITSFLTEYGFFTLCYYTQALIYLCSSAIGLTSKIKYKSTKEALQALFGGQSSQSAFSFNPSQLNEARKSTKKKKVKCYQAKIHQASYCGCFTCCDHQYANASTQIDMSKTHPQY